MCTRPSTLSQTQQCGPEGPALIYRIIKNMNTRRFGAMAISYMASMQRHSAKWCNCARTPVALDAGVPMLQQGDEPSPCHPALMSLMRPWLKTSDALGIRDLLRVLQCTMCQLKIWGLKLMLIESMPVCPYEDSSPLFCLPQCTMFLVPGGLSVVGQCSSC